MCTISCILNPKPTSNSSNQKPNCVPLKEKEPPKWFHDNNAHCCHGNHQ